MPKAIKEKLTPKEPEYRQFVKEEGRSWVAFVVLGGGYLTVKYLLIPLFGG